MAKKNNNNSLQDRGKRVKIGSKKDSPIVSLEEYETLLDLFTRSSEASIFSSGRGKLKTEFREYAKSLGVDNPTSIGFITALRRARDKPDAVNRQESNRPSIEERSTLDRIQD